MLMKLFCCAAVFLLLRIAPACAATVESWTDGNWFIGAYTDEQTGQFSHCAMSADYESGIMMIFAVYREFTWALGLADPQWQLTPGTVYPLSFTIDGRAPIPAQARAVSANQVVIPLQDNVYLFNQFRRGIQLRVDAIGRSFFFNLSGTSRVLAETLGCAQRHVVAEAPTLNTNPFVAAAPQSQSNSDKSNSKAEATAILANVLSQAGIVAFHILTPAEEPKEWANYDATWAAPGVFGFLNVIGPNSELAISDIRAAVIASDAQTCKGKFVSGAHGAKAAEQKNFTSVFTACENGSSSFAAYYNVISRPSGGYYVFGTASFGLNAAPAESDETKVSAAAFRVLSVH